jgi:hypothetical protein
MIIPRTRRPEWGPWNLDQESFVLWTAAGGYRYEVDLEECTTSARVLDRIIQLAGKEWARGDPAARNALIAGLVTALDDVLRPQATLCSFGQSRRLSGPAIRKLVTQTRLQAQPTRRRVH